MNIQLNNCLLSPSTGDASALLEQCTIEDIYIIRNYRVERHKRQDTNASRINT